MAGSVLQCVAVRCSVLQCVAVCCSVLQCVAVCCSVLQCVAVCCSVLQCVALCCSVLQHFHVKRGLQHWSGHFWRQSVKKASVVPPISRGASLLFLHFRVKDASCVWKRPLHRFCTLSPSLSFPSQRGCKRASLILRCRKDASLVLADLKSTITCRRLVYSFNIFMKKKKISLVWKRRLHYFLHTLSLFLFPLTKKLQNSLSYTWMLKDGPLLLADLDSTHI